MTVKEIKSRLGGTAHLSSIVNLMCDRGLLVGGPSRGRMEEQPPHLSPLERMVPRVDLHSVGVEESGRGPGAPVPARPGAGDHR